MKKTIYEKAAKNGCFLECACTDINQTKWDQLMKGARKANRKKVLKAAIIAGLHIEKEEFKNEYFNPYDHYVTKTHIIYVHSSIEYFIKVNQ